MYLRVSCTVCHKVWNYYDYKTEDPQATTAKNVLGGMCPNCDCVGIIGAVIKEAQDE